MGKYLLLISLYICILTFAYSRESNNNSKAIEFSYGGLINHNFSFSKHNVLMSDLDANANANASSPSAPDYTKQFPLIDHSYYLLPHQSLKLAAIFSFYFYPVNSIGIGFTYDIGPGLFFVLGYNLSTLDVTYRDKISLKIGSLKKKSWFIVEGGYNLGGSFDIFTNYPKGWNLSYGPSMFIGYEKLFNNKLIFSIGINFDYKDKIASHYKYFNIYSQSNNFYYIGIECRIKVGKVILLKKK